METNVGIKETYQGKQWSITAVFDEEIARKALITRDALMAARQLLPSEMITGLHPDVVQMVMRAGTQKVTVDYCVKYIRQDNETQHKRLLNDALEIAILWGNFADDYPVQLKEIDLEIPEDYFDDTLRNQKRARSFLPDLPVRMGFHPDEQRCALIQLLKIADPFFHQWFAHLFERAATTFGEMIQKEVIASYEGKSKSGMAADRSVETKSPSDRRVRRTKKRVSLIQRSDGDIG